MHGEVVASQMLLVGPWSTDVNKCDSVYCMLWSQIQQWCIGRLWYFKTICHEKLCLRLSPLYLAALQLFMPSRPNVMKIFWELTLSTDSCDTDRKQTREIYVYLSFPLLYSQTHWFFFFFFAFQLLPEHRPPTILRPILCLAFRFAPAQFHAPSSSTVLFHVFFGLPLSRQPWGVHLRAFFIILLPAFLIVYPIHVHFLRVIVVSMESCSAMFHIPYWLSCLFQLMLKILLKQLLM